MGQFVREPFTGILPFTVRERLSSRKYLKHLTVANLKADTCRERIVLSIALELNTRVAFDTLHSAPQGRDTCRLRESLTDPD